MTDPLPAGSYYGLTLNPDNTDEALRKSIWRAAMLLGIALPAVDSHEFGTAVEVGKGPMFIAKPMEADHDKLRDSASNLIVSASFGDLLRGLKSSLDTAWVHCRLYSEADKHRHDLPDFVKLLERKANRFEMADVLKRLAPMLRRPLEFEDTIQSFQAVRNCIEHRDGIVDPKDAPDGRLVLRYPTVAWAIEGYNGWVEWEGPMPPPSAAELISARREIVFDVGETVCFSPEQMALILAGCTQLGDDLRRALPTQPQSLDDRAAVQASFRDGHARLTSLRNWNSG